MSLSRETMKIEKRPGARQAATVAYPPEWVERHGEPPTEERALKAWLKANHVDDLIAFTEGRSLPWLDEDAARRELERTGGDL